MSGVHENDRKENTKFRLLIQARELTLYTIKITSNEKIFSPDYQRALTDDIINQAKNIYMNARTANDIKIRVGSMYQDTDWMERRRLQKEAIASCNRLLSLIDIAYKLFHLASQRVKFWGKMTIDVRNRIQGWSNAESKLYSSPDKNLRA